VSGTGFSHMHLAGVEKHCCDAFPHCSLHYSVVGPLPPFIPIISTTHACASPRFMLSVVAAHHKVPFFVAAPTTTLDPQLADGSLIEIEQRPAEEITHFRGTRVVTERVQVCPWCGAVPVAINTCDDA
jgi:hypothetical protein